MAGEPQEYDVLLKVLMIGDSDVGKSSILLRFTDDLYNDEQPVTIGVDFKIKMVEVGGKKINLTIWDTAGQEKFRSLTSSGTQGIILAYDVTRRDSFANLTSWLSEIETYTTNPDVVKLLVGNKIDKENREVSREEAVEFARSQAMLFIECSAKTKLGVQQAFEELVLRILETPTLLKSNAKPAVSVDSSADSQQNGYCYC